MLAKAFGDTAGPGRRRIFEVTNIHSIAGQTDTLIVQPPLRAPHHTSSYVSIIGGGSTPKSKEITLAHRGVLFLDEDYPGIRKQSTRELAEPLEEGCS